jgi:hypothetical protein
VRGNAPNLKRKPTGCALETMKVLLLLLVLAATLGSSFAAEKTEKETADERFRRLMEGPHVKRGVIPQVKLQRAATANAEEEAQIKKHIANLAKIERPDFGLSGTMGGMAFAPVPGADKPTGGFLLTDHRLQTADDFRELVAFGPRALPFLLDALEDSTATRLSREGSGRFLGIFLCAEMDSNPTNSIEQKAIASLPNREIGFQKGRGIADEWVKVGDVCFVIIGQIVGRAYLALRYQPTALIVVNSPVEEKALAKAVRDIWSSTNATQRVFDSLLFDYSTEGVFNGDSLDGWDTGNRLQCEAAMRMLYYFPRETAGLIAERLSRLDVRKPSENRAQWMDRYLTNGVRAEEFVKAVAWSNDPGIRRELLSILKRTTHTQILLAALSGIDASEDDVARKRLNEMIDQLPADERGPYGEGYNLLVALGKRVGPAAKPTFVRYLENASLQRWRSMAQVLRQTQSEWAVELLAPALMDKREFGWTYALAPGNDEPRRPIRVCDEAAETISLSRPDLPFRMEGEHENLDRQIAVIRARIAGVGL